MEPEPWETHGVVRPARTGDAAALWELASVLQTVPPVTEVSATLEDLLGSPDHLVLVAEHRGQPVGWIHAARSSGLLTGTIVTITGLAVDADHQRRGVGSALIARTEEWARGCSSFLRVRSRTRREGAHAFYERLGFEYIKTQNLYGKSFERS